MTRTKFTKKVGALAGGLMALSAIAIIPVAEAGTPIRQIAARPGDFASAIYSVFADWQISQAWKGAVVSPWGAALKVLQYCLWWNPVGTAILLTLAGIGLAWLFHSFIWPRIQVALRSRGFST